MTSPLMASEFICKLGCTRNPRQRLQDFYTAHPPIGKHEIVFQSLWYTNATDQAELLQYESQWHQQFAKYRLSRQRFGDSEFFQFPDEHAYNMVQQFLEQQKDTWGIQRVSISDMSPSISSNLRDSEKHYEKLYEKLYEYNDNFISHEVERMDVLDQIQVPVISSICDFISDPFKDGGTVIAPCGSGKTVMASKSLKTMNIMKCIICCPSVLIQRQWKKALVDFSHFQLHEILLVGGDGSPRDISEKIDHYINMSKYCIITTNMSSIHLANFVKKDNINIVIFDEGHHMAGVIRDTTREGKTRQFLQKIISFEVKRLFLTYTPRYILNNNCDNAITTFSMDDDKIFGSTIAELNYRCMINSGILPDYRVWHLYDEKSEGQGIEAIASCLLEAWEKTEIRHNVEKHIFHHMIVFAQSQKDVQILEQFLKLNVSYTYIASLKNGDNVKSKIQDYQNAPRAILINCMILNEGVDIPITNAVSIVYPKKAPGQIIQMLLRAGRWYPGKSEFHILIPTLNNETKFEVFVDVLNSLSSYDIQLPVDKNKARVKNCNSPNSCERLCTHPSTLPGNVVVKSCDILTIQELISSRENKKQSLRRIQEICIKEGIQTSSQCKERFPDCEDLTSMTMSWYDFLHPNAEKIKIETFVSDVLIKNGIKSIQSYETWRNTAPSTYPCVQNIDDGYFPSVCCWKDILRISKVKV
jgi:superfamily II DNA or RNA helicase